MEIEDGRDAIEFFLLGLGARHPEYEASAQSHLWAEIGVIPEPVLQRISDGGFGVLKPDFHDDIGRPRLRLASIARTLGVAQKMLAPLQTREWGNDRFRDAADFIRLTRRRHDEAVGAERAAHLRAWATFHSEAPDDLAAAMAEKFAELFEPLLAGMTPLGTNENGEHVFVAGEVALALGIPEYEVLRQLAEYEDAGVQGIATEMPEPDGKAH